MCLSTMVTFANATEIICCDAVPLKSSCVSDDTSLRFTICIVFQARINHAGTVDTVLGGYEKQMAYNRKAKTKIIYLLLSF